MSESFGTLAGSALIIFAFVAPLAYCTVQRGGPTTAADLHLACITAKGEWKSTSWSDPYTCVFPKQSAAEVTPQAKNQ